MYKKILLGLYAGLCVYNTVYAQFNLLNGAPHENAIVKEPYLFWDLMRNSTPSWVRYYRTDEGSAYGKSNRLIQRKDQSGRFNHLETSIWNLVEVNWVLLDKHVYQRTIVEEKLVSETAESWVRDELDGPLFYTKTVLDNFYQNNKLRKANNELSNETGITSTGETFITYNTLNQRIYDSSVINNFRFTEHYTYDNNNCVFRASYLNGNPVANTGWKYTNGILTEVKNYGIMTPDSIPNSAMKYTYNPNGLLSEVIVSEKVDGVFTNLYQYKHGYTETGKLKWMCNNIYQDSEWIKLDSIVIAYANDIIDTSYGYKANIDNEWNDWANFMFVFDEQLVGINSTINETINFSVFPNPANDYLSINTEASNTINRVTITDLLGKTVYEQPFLSSQIKLNNFKPGVYFLSIESTDGRGVKKIIIE
ncbi:MAG: T9SS type A sorting domain-containing protein [Bacteroidia bacterium]|nr:T9SS type A sorting domain-containing protein [Bacteroidia bacterium]